MHGLAAASRNETWYPGSSRRRLQLVIEGREGEAASERQLKIGRVIRREPMLPGKRENAVQHAKARRFVHRDRQSGKKKVVH